MGFFKRKSKKNKNKDSSESAASTVDPECSGVKENNDEDTSAETPSTDIPLKEDLDESENIAPSKDTDDEEEFSPSPPPEAIDTPSDDKVIPEKDPEEEEENDEDIQRQNTSESYNDEKPESIDERAGEDLKLMSEDDEDVPVDSQRAWDGPSTDVSPDQTMSFKEESEKKDSDPEKVEEKSVEDTNNGDELNYSLSSKSFRGFMNRITSSKGGDDDEPLTIFGIRCGGDPK